MDIGVRDLEIAFFIWFNDKCSKDLSNRPVYTVLNTHNLDMILQLKNMPIVVNPVRIAANDGKSEKCYGLCYALSSNEFGDLRFFLRFESNLIIFYLQSKFEKYLYAGSFGRERH